MALLWQHAGNVASIALFALVGIQCPLLCNSLARSRQLVICMFFFPCFGNSLPVIFSTHEVFWNRISEFDSMAFMHVAVNLNLLSNVPWSIDAWPVESTNCSRMQIPQWLKLLQIDISLPMLTVKTGLVENSLFLPMIWYGSQVK